MSAERRPPFPQPQEQRKRILLIDFDDQRRDSRVRLLLAAGYEVRLRQDWIEAEEIDREGEFDLVILALRHRDLQPAVAYSERLTRSKPELPILLLTDVEAIATGGARKSLEAGHPGELIETIASMLAGSTHVRELGSDQNPHP